MNKIDTCGMSCPQPVLMTKKALDRDSSGADIIVDNNTARENVEKFLKNLKYSITVKKEEDTFVSFLPIFKSCTGVTMEGFKYPTDNLDFDLGSTRGVSNEVESDKGIIKIKSGISLVIKSRD